MLFQSIHLLLLLVIVELSCYLHLMVYAFLLLFRLLVHLFNPTLCVPIM